MTTDPITIHRSIAVDVFTPASHPVEGNCKWVPRDGFQHIALVALGFIELFTELDFVLMQAPPGFEVVGS